MGEALHVILDNLESWSLGFLCGWIMCKSLHHVWHKTHTEHEAMRTEWRYTLLGGVITLLAAVLVGGMIYLAENYTDGATTLWNMSRHINYPLGCIVAAGVTYRLVLLAFEKPRWHRDARTLHLFFWFVYVAGNLLAAAMTSHHYEMLGADASWVSGFRTILMLGGLVLTIWWPHPVPRREETSR